MLPLIQSVVDADAAVLGADLDDSTGVKQSAEASHRASVILAAGVEIRIVSERRESAQGANRISRREIRFGDGRFDDSPERTEAASASRDARRSAGRFAGRFNGSARRKRLGRFFGFASRFASSARGNGFGRFLGFGLGNRFNLFARVYRLASSAGSRRRFDLDFARTINALARIARARVASQEFGFGRLNDLTAGIANGRFDVSARRGRGNGRRDRSARSGAANSSGSSRKSRRVFPRRRAIGTVRATSSAIASGTEGRVLRVGVAAVAVTGVTRSSEAVTAEALRESGRGAKGENDRENDREFREVFH